MMESANAWYQMDFTHSLITVYEADETTIPKYELDTVRTISISIASPTGLTGGVFEWNNEPTGVTEIIIERRDCPSAVYELPSTAGTLAWQIIATITITNTTQSYTDNNYNSVYKYRMRFINGLQSSNYLLFPENNN